MTRLTRSLSETPASVACLLAAALIAVLLIEAVLTNTAAV